MGKKASQPGRVYPLFVTRGALVFPQLTFEQTYPETHLAELLRTAGGKGGKVVVTSLRDIGAEKAAPENILRFGTLCEIREVRHRPGDRLQVSLYGLRRARVLSVERLGEVWSAQLEFPRSGRGAGIDEAVKSLKRTVTRYLRGMDLRPGERREFWKQALEIEDPERLADCIADQIAWNAVNFNPDFSKRFELLETVSLEERLQKVRNILEDHIRKRRTRLAEERQKVREPWRNKPVHREWHRIRDLLIWRRTVRGAEHGSFPSHSFRPNPLVDGNSVFASIASPGMAVCVDRASGRVRWRRPVGQFASEAVCLAHGLLLVPTCSALVALDPESGRPRWEFRPVDRAGEWIYSLPTSADGRIFLGDRRGTLHALDVDTGETIWSKVLSKARNNDVNATAIVEGDLVITATNARLVAAYDTATGRRIWRTDLDSGSVYELVRYQAGILICTGPSLYLLEAKDGRILHRWHWPRRRVWTFCVAGERLLVLVKDPDVDPSYKRIVSVQERMAGSGGFTLEAYEGRKLVASYPDWKESSAMRWEPETGMVYESRLGGFSVLDPYICERIHGFLPQTDLRMAALATVRDRVIYLMADSGTLYALKHPTG